MDRQEVEVKNQALKPLPTALEQKLIGTMEQIMTEYDLPSFSMAVGVKGQVVFAEAQGMADVQQQIPATVDTMYSVGSIAKSMTGVAMARLVDQGKLQPEKSAGYYLPDYTQAGANVTVAQLASHTAGITRPWDARHQKEFVDVKERSSPTEVLDILDGKALLFKPGAGFKYSSAGYVLLSGVLEKAAKMPFEKMMKQQVWMPLTMNNTHLDVKRAGVDPVTGQDIEARYYQGRDKQGHWQLEPLPRDRSFLFGGGGFISTTLDMVKLAQAVFDPSFLSKDSREKMTTPVKLANGEVNPQYYDWGWRMQALPDLEILGNPVELIHHGGVTDQAATAFMVLMPEYEAVLAFATNTNPEKGWKIRPQLINLLKEVVISQQADSGTSPH